MATVNNPWLRGVKGKVAGMVVQGGTTRGTTIIRERVDPKDANTMQQRVQRVVVATAGVAYGAMADICDHSFEGYSGKSENMNRFRSLNANMLRQKIGSEASSGIAYSGIYDFTPLKTKWLASNPYIMSEGSLPRIPATVENGEILIPIGIPSGQDIAGDTFSYEDLVGQNGLIPALSQIGMQLGDQITICAIRRGARISEGSEYGGIDVNAAFSYCRFILKGKTADATAFTISGDSVLSGVFDPTSAHPFTQLNGWTVSMTIRDGNWYLRFYPPVFGEWANRGLRGACAILSRKVGDKWLRSPSVMQLLTVGGGTPKDSIAFALSTAISRNFTTLEFENDLYLNNAQD